MRVANLCKPAFAKSRQLLQMAWIPFLILLAGQTYPPVSKFQIAGRAQGTTYHITYYATDSIIRKEAIDSILKTIDHSLSLYQAGSLINQFNNAPEAIIPDRHMYMVMKKAMQVYKDSKGLFDVTIFPLTDIWGFGPVKRSQPPDSMQVNNILPCVSSRYIRVRKKKISKEKPCVKLDANGIAQGYSVDIIAEYLEEKGIKCYIAELGGEIRVKGKKPDGSKMSVGIEAPGEDMFSPVLQKIVYLNKGAITTSGNYRNYYESEGRKITHIIDPATGFPQHNNVISATVVAKDAITADAYDNVFMLMGVNEAIRFAEKKKEMSLYLIYRRSDGTIADTMSQRFRFLLQP